MAGNTIISATLSAHCISMHEFFKWNVRVVWFTVSCHLQRLFHRQVFLCLIKFEANENRILQTYAIF